MLQLTGQIFEPRGDNHIATVVEKIESDRFLHQVRALTKLGHCAGQIATPTVHLVNRYSAPSRNDSRNN
jgi:hypothetical protein